MREFQLLTATVTEVSHGIKNLHDHNPDKLTITFSGRKSAYQVVRALLQELEEEQADTYSVFIHCTITEDAEEIDIPF